MKADGRGNGSSWDNASNDLQAVINASQQGDQVWIAAGLYTPVVSKSAPGSGRVASGIDPRTISFSMKARVEIYGGFPDSGNPTFAQRALTYPSSTTLSGEIGNPGIADNSYHVIKNSLALYTSAILDGVVITGGNADGSSSSDNLGGGVYNNGGGSGNECSPTFRNCLFQSNNAEVGGAILNNGYFGTSSPVLTNCAFQNNTATRNSGGGDIQRWP